MNHPHRRYSSYEDAHVDFVSTEDGTTVGEILKVLLSITLTPLLSSLILPWVVPPSFARHAVQESSLFMYIRSIVEYPCIVILPLWIITIFAGQDEGTIRGNDISGIVILAACLGIMIVNYGITEPKWEGFQNYWSQIKDRPLASLPKDSNDETASSSEKKESNRCEEKVKYPFITNYRAIVTYITVLAILAVDFTIFPRRYSKTKVYGYSLMDIGTGTFIFSNGIVAPEAKDRKSNLRKSWISSLPLFVLGLIRLISVKGIEYHEVVEEYGVHWNFFFTLAAVKLLSATVFSFTEPSNSLKLSFVTGIAYEILLVKFGIQEGYILNPSVPRDSLVDANREGLFSVLGYLSIYFASVYVGKVIYTGKKKTVEEWVVYACRSGLHVILLWLIFILSTAYGYPASRRVANMSYILWILASNYTVLWTCIVINLVQTMAQFMGLLHGPLITFELDLLKKKGVHKIKNLNDKTKKKEAYGRSSEEVQVEEKLLVLEDKLQEFKQSGRASISSEVASLIENIEVELELIGKKAEEKKEEESEKDKQTGEETTERNLISLPDLAKSPVTLDAICYNGLGVFLLGNLLTGLVNCMVHTIYVPGFMALCYLWAYASCVALTSLILYTFEIQLKVW